MTVIPYVTRPTNEADNLGVVSALTASLDAVIEKLMASSTSGIAKVLFQWVGPAGYAETLDKQIEINRNADGSYDAVFGGVAYQIFKNKGTLPFMLKIRGRFPLWREIN